MDDVRGDGQTLHMPTAPRTALRILSLARLISLTGSTAAFTALFYTMYHRTGSAAWLSAALLPTFGVSGLIAPVAGALGDRFDRKGVMILSDLGGAVCFGAMALVHDPALLLVGGFLAAIAESPSWSASGAAVPNLVQEKDLAWANGLLAAGRNAGGHYRAGRRGGAGPRVRGVVAVRGERDVVRRVGGPGRDGSRLVLQGTGCR